MERRLSRPLSITAVSMAIGAVAGSFLGYGVDNLLILSNGSATQQIAGIEQCADHLGITPRVSISYPAACENNLDESQNFFEYTQDGRNYYLWPTAAMVRSDEQTIEPTTISGNRRAEHAGYFFGAGVGALIFGFSSLVLKSRRKYDNHPSDDENGENKQSTVIPFSGRTA